jgi:homopolymeric O-antigen transport system ATP-binding protein
MGVGGGGGGLRMAPVAVRVQNLSKEYRIGLRAERYKTLRDSLASLVTAPVRVLRRRNRPEGDDLLLALRDVNFEIRSGEVVGIIGPNGAGKSTLLKILSRITEPTRGFAEIHGRVGSLLEVGTGFHPELTGRENIYLNGAILGMRRVEIERKFDEIVAFSEVEQFIDTPVKRYSSGMYLRLAFAVAAHLEPEILLVDEVLAVGDAEFQKKCLGKMGDVAQEGRTVIFVSHNMPAVQALCTRAILLRNGSVAIDGSTGDVLREYLGHLLATAAHAFEDNPDRRGDGTIRFTGARVLDADGRPVERLVAGTPMTLELTYENRIGAERADLMLAIVNHLGVTVAHFSTRIAGFVVGLAPTGIVTCRIPNLPLPPGEYRVVASVVFRGHNTDRIPNALAFTVESSVFFPTGRVPRIEHGACLIAHEWKHRIEQPATAEPARSEAERV